MRRSILGVLVLLGIGAVIFIGIEYGFTSGYVCLQIIVLVLCVYILWKGNVWYTHTNTAASILTFIGVFGTFLGIFIGLQAFEIQNIEASISDLLEGLKLAFLTSLVGIGSAILLKGVVAPLFQTFQKGKNPIETERRKFIDALEGIETSGETNLLEQLVTLNTTVGEEGRETRKMLTGIKEALTGEDESTVFAQLQGLTSTVSKKVDEITEKVGKIASGQLIEALKDVIRDFNKNLTDQFGENFKQLNEAVEKTVEWQKQYRQQMNALAYEFWIAAQSVEQSAESLTTIKEQSDSLVSIAGKLDPILHTLNDQLKAFSELREKALDAFPVIKAQLTTLTTEFSSAVQTAIKDSHESMKKQRTALEEQALKLGDIVERNKEDIENHVNTLHSALRKEVDTFNKSLEEELAKSLTTLAGYLQSLSEGFVKNYEELLKRLVNAGN